MRVSATDLNKRPGALLEKAINEAVIIEKGGRPVVVMLSYEHYMKLMRVIPSELEIAYQAMALDKEREQDATSWSEGLIGDVDDEAR